YIDDDDSSATDDGDRVHLLAPSTSASGSSSVSAAVRKAEELATKKQQKQVRDIRAVVDKLSVLASELSAKAPSALTSDPSRAGGNLRVGNNVVRSEGPFASVRSGFAGGTMNVTELRAQVRDIARQVAQLEEKIKINDLLNEIRGDLQQRVNHLKSVLGEGGTVPGSCDASVLISPKSAAKSGANGGRGITARTLTMTNKTPFWNEQSQVYQ
ncbi:tub family protein, partial [Aphelenchoides avenae]